MAGPGVSCSRSASRRPSRSFSCYLLFPRSLFQSSRHSSEAGVQVCMCHCQLGEHAWVSSAARSLPSRGQRTGHPSPYSRGFLVGVRAVPALPSSPLARDSRFHHVGRRFARTEGWKTRGAAAGSRGHAAAFPSCSWCDPRVGCSAKVLAGVTVPSVKGCRGLCPMDGGLSAAAQGPVTGSGTHRWEALTLREIRNKT